MEEGFDIIPEYYYYLWALIPPVEEARIKKEKQKESERKYCLQNMMPSPSG